MIFQYYVFEDIYNQDELKEINNVLDNNKSNLYDGPAPGVIKTSKVDLVLWKNCKKILNKMYQYSIRANEIAFGFSLFNYGEENAVNYNLYNEKNSGEYGWHSDMNVHLASDFKLTAILNISEEPFKGGEFDLFVNGEMNIPSIDKPGSLLVFPTFTMHRVRPVTQGVRKTASMWLSGPKFI
jgi:predicted 2-oxoglutarate/Fe(II)-dependent dioxygenase YbiX